MVSGGLRQSTLQFGHDGNLSLKSKMQKTEQESSGSSGSSEEAPPDPNSSKRRKLQQPTRAGLNWNQGSNSALRTSLKRNTASKPVASTLDGAEDAPAASSVDSSRIDVNNDDLYRGTGPDSTTQPPRGGSGMDAPASDDDSDIMQLHTDEELDRGVMINVSDSRATDMPMPDSDAASSAPAITSQSAPVPHRAKETAHQANGPQSSDEGEIHENLPPAPPLPPPTLADLSPADLRLQVRYFYIGRDLATIPLSDFARCLHCAETGHLTVTCPTQRCRHCSSTEHLSTFCPQTFMCYNCLTPGHERATCREKTKPGNPSAFSVICPLCSRKGHFRRQCELLWRSSGRAYVNLPTDPAAFRRSCFQCGSSEHLGNDCTRFMHRAPASSSWSQFSNDLRVELPPLDRETRLPSAAPPRKGPRPKYPAKNLPARPPSPPPPPPPPGLPPLPPPPAPSTRGRGGRGTGRGASIHIRGVSTRPAALQPLPPHPPPPPPPAPAQAAALAQGKRGRGGGKKKRGGAPRGGGRGASSSGGGGAYHPMPSAAAKAWSKGFQ